MVLFMLKLMVMYIIIHHNKKSFDLVHKINTILNNNKTNMSDYKKYIEEKLKKETCPILSKEFKIKDYKEKIKALWISQHICYQSCEKIAEKVLREKIEHYKNLINKLEKEN